MIQDNCFCFLKSRGYSITVADTIAAINNSEKAYDDLTGDGVHPNEAGREIYFEKVKSVIKDNVAVSTGKMTDTDVINANVHKFDNFIWYDASSDFEREDDTTFTIRNNWGQTPLRIHVIITHTSLW